MSRQSCSGLAPQPWCRAYSSARSPSGTDACELRWKAAGCPEGARAASGCGARGLPVLRGSSSRHPVSGWWRRRRGRHDHAVPPPEGSLVVDRPEMPRILAGMYQMDSFSLVVVYGSGSCKVGFTCDCAPRSMFPSVDVRPEMLCITACTHQKDSCPRRTGKLDSLGYVSFFFYGPLYLAVNVRCYCLRSACVDSSGRRLPEWFLYSAPFWSTVDTCSGQSTGRFWQNHTCFYVKVGFGSIPRGGLDDLKRAIFAAFCCIFALRPRGRECPFFQPSMMKSSSSSMARSGGNAGV